ncbi:hypothetical protein LY90DRAFT_508885 [Neocallimastix californiae]|uniref:VASt domain-containing protein n=1 Tax=Neocallimastix californiae TaxID=1754190 RepID=A0A1Y2CMZ6_9FUNG|nr:hypothetical protein LY90DRAFT_508885 [Neocallimastix californiae]|eukprot:ORY48382.1 hypothetical protein LY90DRAFT_508885 [Neocallimastix californiae]
MSSDNSVSIDISPMKDNDKNNNEKYNPPQEFRTIYKGTFNQPLQRMWRIIYDDGRLPIEERETFLEEYTLIGKTDFNCTDWEAPDKSQHTDSYHPTPIKKGWKRNISYIMDINSPIGPKHTRTSAEEEINVFEPTKILFESTSSTPDVPYGSYFNTIIIQYLYEDEVTHETTFEVYGFIRWNKSCVVKKSIEKFAYDGMIDHQKEMDQALNKYIKENPNPKYIENQNNNLVYDNILEIKEKELEKNHYNPLNYCSSSLANTFNSSTSNYIHSPERLKYHEKIMKLKNKMYHRTHSPNTNTTITTYSSSSLENKKWIVFTSMMVILFYILFATNTTIPPFDTENQTH